MWLLAGIALAAGAGAAAWFAIQDQQPAGREASPTQSTGVASVTSDEQQQKIDALLENARAASNAGRLFEPRGRSAFEFYQRVRQLDPDNTSAAAGLDLLLVNTVDRAQQYTAQGKLDLAQQELGKAALVNPSDNYLLSAKEDLAKAISADLEAAMAVQQRQQQQGNPEAEPVQASPESKEANERAVTPDPIATAPVFDNDSASMSTLPIPALLTQAQADLELNTAGSRDAALASLLQVVEREPGNSDAETMLALLLAQQLTVARIETGKGNFQKAKRAMDAARIIDPDAEMDPASGGVTELLQAGKSYEQQGEYQLAVKTYLEALLIDPKSPDIDASLHRVSQLYISAIQQHLAKSEPEQAAALQSEALTWFPNSEVLRGLLNPASSPGRDQSATKQ
jgi:tetratricopeptide (TPR) repeat protein